MDKIFYNTIDRILYFIEYKGLSIRKFSESIGISHSLLKKTTSLGSDKLENILSAYPEINPEWLLTGKGEMLKLSDTGMNTEITVREGKPIPLVEMAGINGFGHNNFSIKKLDIKAYYVIPKFEGYRIDFMIEAPGFFIYPKYSNGMVIACMIIHKIRFIQWGKVYLIDTQNQGLLIQRLYPSKNDDKKSIECHSENQDYPPFEIPKNEITGLALVVGYIGLE